MQFESVEKGLFGGTKPAEIGGEQLSSEQLVDKIRQQQKEIEYLKRRTGASRGRLETFTLYSLSTSRRTSVQFFLFGVLTRQNGAKLELVGPCQPAFGQIGEPGWEAEWNCCFTRFLFADQNGSATI